MEVVKSASGTFNSPSKMLFVIKGLAQCHVFLGFIMLIMAALGDYISSRINTVRLSGLQECCSFYFLVTGVVGLSGACSSRRGLITAFLLMSLHAVLIFVPAIIIASSFDIHFYQHECYGECDWHLLSAAMPNNSRCQILCGDSVNEGHKRQMMRLGTDHRIDAGLITGACVELLLSLATAVFTGRLLAISKDFREKGSELVPLRSATSEDRENGR